MTDSIGTEQYECVIRRADDADGWLAEYPDLPGVGALGKTRAEAAHLGEEILHAWLSKARELGVDIPAPGEARMATGEFKVRVPKTLHFRLTGLAQARSVSLNEMVSHLLTSGVARTFASESDEAGENYLCAQLTAKRTRSTAEQLRKAHEFSGTWIQRIPRILHLHLQRLAEAEGTSMSAVVLYLLAFETGSLSHALAGLRSSRKQVAA